MATPEQSSNDAPRREASDQQPEAGRQEAVRPVLPRRNYALAITMALIVFALLIGIRVFSGGLGGGHSVPSVLQEEATPEAPAPSN